MYNYSKQNINFAKSMRKELTPWERKLWFSFLKDCGVKFYRQRTIGPYIIDFYSAKHKLAIELDGGQHYEMDNLIKDKDRTGYLNSLGIKVVRFSNADIDINFDSVCEEILLNLKSVH